MQYSLSVLYFVYFGFDNDKVLDSLSSDVQDKIKSFHWFEEKLNNSFVNFRPKLLLKQSYEYNMPLLATLEPVIKSSLHHYIVS